MRDSTDVDQAAPSARSIRLTLGVALVALASLAAAAGEHAQHWSYSGPNGPAHWPGICATGKSQSPIDISTASAAHKKLPPLAFAYRPTALHIIDNGHSIQVDVDKGSTLTVGSVDSRWCNSTSISQAKRKSTAALRRWSYTSCTAMSKGTWPWLPCRSDLVDRTLWSKLSGAIFPARRGMSCRQLE